MKRRCLLVVIVGACADPQDLPPPAITTVTPAATCGRDVAPVQIIGAGFAADAEVVFERPGGGGYTPSPGAVSTFGDALIVVLTNAAEGGPAALEPPIVYDVVVRNPDGQEARLPAALTKYAELGITNVVPPVGARGTTVDVTINGLGFYNDLEVRLGVGAPARVQWVPATSSSAAAATFDLAGVNSGSYAVVVTNRGGCSGGLDGAFLVE
ncbi:MAG: hypothetical protein R3B06_02985 [Kofleriaceae bacterium]